MITDEEVMLNTHMIVRNAKKGAARKRPHRRLQTRMGGELSVDISGPFAKGLPVTDRRENQELWPRYMVVGAFMSYTPKEAEDRYEQERRDRIAAGLEGPVQLEEVVSKTGQTLYFVEVVPTRNKICITGGIENDQPY